MTVIVDTFPWPQSPTRGQIAEVAAAAVALPVLRREVMGAHGWSLSELYRILDERGDNPLHRPDTAVRAAYSMSAKADPLAFLLELTTKSRGRSAEQRTAPPRADPKAGITTPSRGSQILDARPARLGLHRHMTLVPKLRLGTHLSPKLRFP